MAKLTLHFPNQEAYDAYWQGNTPGSKFLCIIDSVSIDESGEQTVSNVLITSSNNNQASNVPVEMGASTIEIVQEQAETIAEQLEEISTQQAIIDEYENGDTVSKTEYDAVVAELDEAAEITTDIKEG